MAEAAGITYDEAGSGTPPLICLHGIGGNTENFRDMLNGLSDGHRVIAWNMPGFAGSQPLPETTFEALSEALGRFMDAMAIEKAVLIGHSIGGMVAQEFAVRNPQKVAALVLIGTTPSFGGRDDTFKKEFLKARLEPLDDGLTMPELAKSFVPEIVAPNASQAVRDSAVRSMSAVPLETYRAIVTCLTTFNRRDDLEKMTQPACLIAGTHDRNAPARTMEKMASRLPQAEYHLIEDVGHMIQMEAPDRVNAIVRTFLAAHDTGQ